MIYSYLSMNSEILPVRIMHYYYYYYVNNYNIKIIILFVLLFRTPTKENTYTNCVQKMLQRDVNNYKQECKTNKKQKININCKIQIFSDTHTE